MPKFWTKARKKRVLSCVTKWQRTLILERWDFTFSFAEDQNSEAAAEVSACSVYLHAEITFYPGTLKEPNDLDSVVCHELIHCVTHALSQCAFGLLSGTHITQSEVTRHWETTTEHLSKAFNRKQK